MLSPGKPSGQTNIQMQGKAHLNANKGTWEKLVQWTLIIVKYLNSESTQLSGGVKN